MVCNYSFSLKQLYSFLLKDIYLSCCIAQAITVSVLG